MSLLKKIILTLILGLLLQGCASKATDFTRGYDGKSKYNYIFEVRLIESNESIGSAFLYSYKNKHFFITAAHVFNFYSEKEACDFKLVNSEYELPVKSYYSLNEFNKDLAVLTIDYRKKIESLNSELVKQRDEINKDIESSNDFIKEFQDKYKKILDLKKSLYELLLQSENTKEKKLFLKKEQVQNIEPFIRELEKRNDNLISKKKGELDKFDKDEFKKNKELDLFIKESENFLDKCEKALEKITVPDDSSTMIKLDKAEFDELVEILKIRNKDLQEISDKIEGTKDKNSFVKIKEIISKFVWPKDSKKTKELDKSLLNEVFKIIKQERLSVEKSLRLKKEEKNKKKENLTVKKSETEKIIKNLETKKTNYLKILPVKKDEKNDGKEESTILIDKDVLDILIKELEPIVEKEIKSTKEYQTTIKSSRQKLFNNKALKDLYDSEINFFEKFLKLEGVDFASKAHRFIFKDLRMIPSFNKDSLSVGEQIFSVHYGFFSKKISHKQIYSRGSLIEQDFDNKHYNVYLELIAKGSSGGPVYKFNNRQLLGVISKKYSSENSLSGFAEIVSVKILNDFLDSRLKLFDEDFKNEKK